MQKHIAILDAGKEWGGGTNSLLELLKRIDKSRYGFTLLFYNNYMKGTDSDIRTEAEKLGVRFLLLAQEKPVIASDITGPSELVADGETGFLVPVGETDAIADAILRLIENPTLRERMGEKAKGRVIRNFPVEKYVNDVENVFAEVLGH